MTERHETDNFSWEYYPPRHEPGRYIVRSKTSAFPALHLDDNSLLELRDVIDAILKSETEVL